MRTRMNMVVVLVLAALGGCASPPKTEWRPTPAQAFDHALALEECLRLAQSNDVTAAQWRWRLDRAHSRLTQAWKLPNPSLSFLWEDIGLHNTEGKSLLLKEYGVSYPLFFWLTKPSEIAAAKADLRERQATVKDEKRRLALQIGEAFYRLLGEQESLELAEENLDLAEAIDADVRKRHDAGEASGLDEQRAALEADRSRQTYERAQRRLREDQLAFAFALGSDRPVAVHVQGSWPAELPSRWTKAGLISAQLLREAQPVEAIAPPPKLLSAAVANRPDLLAAYQRINTARAHLGLERIRAIPLVDASAGSAYRNTPDGKSASLNFSLPIPLFDQHQQPIRMARADLHLAEAEAEQFRRRVIAEVTDAWAQWQTTLHEFQTYSQRRAAAAERIARGARDLFRAGEVSYLDVMQARRDLMNARQESLTAKVDLAQAQWRLQVVAAWEPTRVVERPPTASLPRAER